jgi:hypothetical protein
MKTQAEIVIKAKAYAESIGNKDGMSAYDYVMGYNKCQEDMVDKKYTEEDMYNCWQTAFTDAMNCSNKDYKPFWFKDFINSLKQDNEK